MRNISKNVLTVKGAIYGKDETGKFIKLHLKPIHLEPESVIHVDLEIQRQESNSNLTDGVAGLRITHDGSPTDLIVDLINIDGTGDFALYDPVKNLLFHQPSAQAIISFNLKKRNQAYIILKNVTDELQQAYILLHYDNGKRQYDVKLPKIPPQCVEIVDIRHLRDAYIPDRQGAVLPTDVEFGGGFIFSEPGAVVVSDPSFFYTISADVSEHSEEPPWFPPSCARDLSEDRPQRTHCCRWRCVSERLCSKRTRWGICVYCCEFKCTETRFGCNAPKPLPHPVDPSACRSDGACRGERDICRRP